MWNQNLYQKTIDFAARAHKSQKVPSKEYSYVVHLSNVAMEIMRALFEERWDKPDLAVQCALLHDVLEDTQTSVDEVREAFGEEVLAGVQALTKDKGLEKGLQMEDSLRRILALSREIACVKMADRITNLQKPPSAWDRAKIEGYHREAVRIHQALGSASRFLAGRLEKSIEGYARYFT